MKRWCGTGPEQNEGLALVEELGCVFHSTREGRVCGHRFGWVKLVVGRGGFSGYFSFLSDVCASKVTTPGLVGDVRKECTQAGLDCRLECPFVIVAIHFN